MYPFISVQDTKYNEEETSGKKNCSKYTNNEEVSIPYPRPLINLSEQSGERLCSPGHAFLVIISVK